MDSVVAQLLARLSMFLTQELDLPVDMPRFSSEPEYAAQILELVDEMGNHEFRAIAARIRKRQAEIFALTHVSEPVEGDTTALRSTEDEPLPEPGKPA